MKILKLFLKGFVVLLSLVAIVLLTIGFFVLIGFIQYKLFVPDDYIIWVFKTPLSSLVFIYEYMIIFLFGIFLARKKESFKPWIKSFKQSIFSQYKKRSILAFLVLNILLMYTLLSNVTVVGDNYIKDYTFFSPKGNDYTLNDIVKIDTGVYGKKTFTHAKGDFYYILELKNGPKVDLTQMGGYKGTKYDEDPRFIIEKLDKEYVGIGIGKISSMDNFEYTTENLDQIYTDKIKKILLNVE